MMKSRPSAPHKCSGPVNAIEPLALLPLREVVVLVVKESARVPCRIQFAKVFGVVVGGISARFALFSSVDRRVPHVGRRVRVERNRVPHTVGMLVIHFIIVIRYTPGLV